MRKLNDRGFSLVEVMLTVSILGVLASIAIASYKEFVLRAKISQAKTGLASLYQAEMAFRAEFDQFTSRFDAISYQLVGTAHFNIGFENDFPPPPLAPQGTMNCTTLCGTWGSSSSLTPPACPAGYTQPTCSSSSLNGLDGLGTSLTPSAFRASAHAHFSTDPRDWFSFTMDENKRLLAVIPSN
jgi:prepilin-type N-terminal cleavage/methylation domain-containing protein